MKICTATLDDVDSLQHLYQIVSLDKSGLIRKSEEITTDYIYGFVKNASENGIILLAKIDHKIIGEIHAYTPPIYAMQHLLADLTIVVHPSHQNKGIGRSLFKAFLEIVELQLTHIKRVELFTRESNHRNVKFYEGLGFKNEGRQEDKIFVRPGFFETPIHMAWVNPRYGLPRKEPIN